MMKKQILFFLLLVPCVGLKGSHAFEQTKCWRFGERAWAIRLDNLSFGYAADDLGLSTTRGVQGVDFREWLDGKSDINVDVVEQKEDGSFSLRSKLSDFSRDDLAYFYKTTDANGNLTGFSLTDNSEARKSLALVQALKMNRCVLCDKDYDTSVLVMHAKQGAEKVCNALKRAEEERELLSTLNMNDKNN
jgi:hypothetical protein